MSDTHTHTYESLFGLSGPEQVKLFNSLVGEGQKTKKFADKTAGAKRIWALLKDKQPEVTHVKPTKPEPEVKKAAEPKPVPAPKGRKARGRRFVFPMLDHLKAVRLGSERHTIVMMTYGGGEHWKDGATFNQIMAATWGKREDMDEATQIKTTYEGIRLIHYFCGYGMMQDGDGRIKLFYNPRGKSVDEKAILPACINNKGEERE